MFHSPGLANNSHVEIKKETKIPIQCGTNGNTQQRGRRKSYLEFEAPRPSVEKIYTKQSPSKGIGLKESPLKGITSKESPPRTIISKESPLRGIRSKETPPRGSRSKQSTESFLHKRELYDTGAYHTGFTRSPLTSSDHASLPVVSTVSSLVSHDRNEQSVRLDQRGEVVGGKKRFRKHVDYHAGQCFFSSFHGSDSGPKAEKSPFLSQAGRSRSADVCLQGVTNRIYYSTVSPEVRTSHMAKASVRRAPRGDSDVQHHNIRGISQCSSAYLASKTQLHTYNSTIQEQSSVGDSGSAGNSSEIYHEKRTLSVRSPSPSGGESSKLSSASGSAVPDLPLRGALTFPCHKLSSFIRKGPHRSIPFPTNSATSKLSFQRGVKSNMVTLGENNLVGKSVTHLEGKHEGSQPAFVFRGTQRSTGSPRLLTRDQCIWDLKQLEKNFVDRDGRDPLKGGSLSSTSLSTHDRGVSSVARLRTNLALLTSPEGFSGHDTDPLTDGFHARYKATIRRLELENEHLKERITRQSRKITVLEGHMERDETVISRKEQCLSMLKIYLQKVGREYDRNHPFGYHINRLLSLVLNDSENILSPLASCSSDDQDSMKSERYNERSRAPIPPSSEFPREKSYGKLHSRFLHEDTAQTEALCPVYPLDACLEAPTPPHLLQAVPLRAGHTRFQVTSPSFSDRLGGMEIQDVEVSTVEGDVISHPTSSGSSTLKTTDIVSVKGGGSGRTSRGYNGSLDGEAATLLNSTNDPTTLDRESSNNLSSERSTNVGSPARVPCTVSSHTDNDKKRRPRVPLLCLEKRNVGFGAWLSGEATQGDTYNVSLDPVRSN